MGCQLGVDREAHKLYGRLAFTWSKYSLVRQAWDLDGRLAVIGPLKLSRDPRVITWYQQLIPIEYYIRDVEFGKCSRR